MRTPQLRGSKTALRITPLAEGLIDRMARLTALRSAERSLENARENLPQIRLTIADLAARAPLTHNESAIVMSAGPSLHRQNPVKQMREHGYTGTVIAADGALGYCLRNGLVPDYVVTVDPHPVRVCRWFGDPELESRQDEDDYFRRQDLDPHLGVDEFKRNREMIELVNRHGPSIQAIICTSVAPNVTKRCLESGMELYWWNPLMDDVERPESVSRQLYRMNGAPCMVSGGNVGASAWVAASQVLGKREIAVAGMDFSYPPGTPIEKTQYFKELIELFGEQAHEALIWVKNPHLHETWLTDPAYYWYRQMFLEMTAQADCVTYNCTEGGILFGKSVRWMPLRRFLAKYSRVAACV
ncbi:MAG: DUF115 domain-containing protein [Candidatus Omnitrophica bacterium]|nr:DUF115 domain-containing protein [Candidatus Omnitrophota bacterium]